MESALLPAIHRPEPGPPGGWCPRGRVPGGGRRPRANTGSGERGAPSLGRFETIPAPVGLRCPAPPALHLFQSALEDTCGQAYAALSRACAAGDPAGAAAAYGRLFAGLAAEGWGGDAWRCHVAAGTAAAGNTFTLGADPGPGVRAAARLDLAALAALAADAVFQGLRTDLAAAGYTLAPLVDLGGRMPRGVAADLVGSRDWPGYADRLRTAARAGGAGAYARHAAYRWLPDPRDRAGGRLAPVPRPDPVRLKDLCGYEAERGQVVENTERFVRGLPANDVLLYGDRGTGKSSTVKALLHRYAPEGLRLVEVGRRDLPSLPRLCETLEGQPQRFILYVDDMSFEEGETEYKDAKAALQGGIPARPENVLVYATSNRRHLVRERLSERGDPGGDDPRAGDAVEEKLSLADRFGLTVVFAAPDQALYLRIVAHLAAARDLALPEAELRSRALRWSLWQGGRSGRTARQFVQALEGEWRTAQGSPAGAHEPAPRRETLDAVGTPAEE